MEQEYITDFHNRVDIIADCPQCLPSGCTANPKTNNVGKYLAHLKGLLDEELLADCEARRTLFLADQKSKKYIGDRQKAYPAIGEQLDMLYKDMQNGTTNWQDLITKIKLDNPKG